MRELKQQSVAALIDKHLDEGDSFELIVDRFRNSLIVHALARTNGNIAHAAELLKLHRNNISRWMGKFHIDAKEFHEDRKASMAASSLESNLESQGIRSQD